MTADQKTRRITPAKTSALPLDPGLWADPRSLHRALRRAGHEDLSEARLLEGHVNAHRLVCSLGSDAQRRRTETEMRAGVLFGVWGADSATKVAWDGRVLSGAKQFASGLGRVGKAIVPAIGPDAQQLVIVDASDPGRHRSADWNMTGMQASLSGGFVCDGLTGETLGAPGTYQREPGFLGGTWRIASVTLGGIAGLLDRTALALERRGYLDAEAQALRLGPLAIRALAAEDAILRAGVIAEGAAGQKDPEAAATRSVAMRLLTEELAQEAIAGVERSVGLSLFRVDDPVGTQARDLACYIRQAARDAMMLRVARSLLTGGTGQGTRQGAGLEAWFDA
ncbi:acyl-CoA dehydrogenase [Pararhodobacter marinus]|uniref:acyl-CoA dehydrogenase n=1 Tax=Pararhodobacter marinus TaxID=2184063 RepID=UPI003513BA34